MGYQALLFCPDEKTARTVTQVLGELEFTIEACLEPFAAVKKLMGQHFDAVVVDCDNEQNATLLFKSARNSTSNQGSLAVAVVEGQAGVAKAFRIGANLVLTKPINIEQAKGTLRVARGLLRKGDPAKPPVATAGTPSPAAATASTPAKPVGAKPIPATKSAAPAGVAAPRPVAPAAARPAASPAWPATVAASSPAPHVPVAQSPVVSSPVVPSPAAREEDVLEILEDSTPAHSVPAPAHNAFGVPLAQASKAPAAASAPAAAEVKSEFKAGSPAISGGGAASAPAPAREAQASHAAEILPGSGSTATTADLGKPAEAHSESSGFVGSAPSFTFGGSNLPEQSSGGSKKILLGVAAAAIVVVALYFGYTQFSERSTQPATTPTSALMPVKSTTTPAPTLKPSGAQPTTQAPTSAVSSPSSQPAGPSAAKAVNQTDASSEDITISTASSTKSSGATLADKAAGEAKPAAAPLVVKGGTARVVEAPPVADAPAPSMTGMAAGASAPPPNLVGSQSTPKPILQTINISQGVSQGLLIKKVQPSYPRNALALRIEGPVELMETISKTGDISHIKILNGDPQLARAAAEAVKQWKYKPYLLNGEPVEIQTQVTINFKLPN